MTRLLQLGKAALLFSGAALFCFLSWFAWTATQTVERVGNSASDAIGAFGGTLATINRPCGFNGMPCGTLADVAKTLGTVRGAAGQVETAAHHENSRLTALDSQEDQLFEDSHNLLTGLFADSHAVLTNLATTTSTANDVLAGFKPLPGQVTKAVGDIDALATSKDTKVTLQGVAGLATHLDATAGDIQTALHPILVPAKCTTRGCRLKRAFAQARAAANTSEAIYYTAEVLKLLF